MFFCLAVIDTDTLLKKDLVTLDEALKTADNGVLLAINAISVLISVSLSSLISVGPLSPHVCIILRASIISMTFTGDAQKAY